MGGAQNTLMSRAEAQCIANQPRSATMHADLHQFLSRLVGTILLALAPVVFTAFISMPLSLNRHPGELAQVDAPARHMT
ncbi:MAG: hypothetical protein RIQ60_2073 [Pseudomonadota bacterium]|jgi:hypothetical protein